MKRNFRVLALAGGLCAFSLQQTAIAGSNDLELDPVVVTPTLSAQTVRESLSSVTVIDREQFERQQPREVTDMLRGQPGVNVTRSGSFGKQTSVFTRGTPAEATALLVDGVRLRSATSGLPPWEFLPPQMIEHMEIVRGPRGSLYGADAMGGVVQAFTPDGRDESREWVRGGGGSFGTREFGAGMAAGDERGRLSLAANHFDTDGTPVVEDGNDKGFRNSSALFSAGHEVGDRVELGVLGLHAQGTTEFDMGFGGGETDFLLQAVGASADVLITDNWSSGLQFSEFRDERDTDGNKNESRSHTLKWKNNIVQGNHEFVAGAEFLRDEVEGNYEEDLRDNKAAFGQVLSSFGDLDVQASLRRDDNEAFGKYTTGGLALGYALDQHHTVRLSYGTAFRAPTFDDLYSVVGNPDLDAETSSTVEAGIKGMYQRFFWDLAAYRTRIDDHIVLDENFVAQNISEAEIDGVELGAGAEVAQWSLRASATLSDPTSRITDNRLPRRARKSGRLDLDRSLGDRWSLGASAVAEGNRYDDAGNENRLSGYGLLDLRAGWQFADRWNARLTVNNALDKDYETMGDFKNAGRGYFASIQYGTR